MAHLRKANRTSIRSDTGVREWSFEPEYTATGKFRIFTAFNCVLFCIWVLCTILGGFIGVYYKNDLVRAYNSTRQQIKGLSSVRAAQSPLGETLLVGGDAEKLEAAKIGAEAAANAATIKEGEEMQKGWDRPWFTQTVCDNSCAKSKDGKCDDGRAGDGKQVFCDLGTDCIDCGSWTFQVPEPISTIAKPIEMLNSYNVEVFNSKTSTKPSFLMPYTDPQKDRDVSSQMANGAVVELGLTQTWSKVLDGKCRGKGGKRDLILDIGGNFGWYTFYAAAHGCRVVVWEPVPIFGAFLEYGLQVNNVSSQVRVRHKVVGDRAGKLYELTVPSRGIWGTASIDGRNIDDVVVGNHRRVVKAVSERADALIHDDVLIAKVDVEGFEPPAFQSMKGIFDGHKISNIFMEYSPGIYEGRKMWSNLQDMPHMLTFMLGHEYTILHINDSSARGRPLLTMPDWSGELPAFREVTAQNIEIDLEDTKKLQDGLLGCWAPQELVQLNRMWEGCNQTPENLNPKGFRGTFGHNTNIWASTTRKGIKIGPPVGVQSMQQSAGEWYGRDPETGMGGRSCASVRPVSVLLKHRCPCTFPECKEEAKLVEKMTKLGQMGKLTNRP